MTEDLRTQIVRRMADVGGRVRIKSTLNPVLWLCAIVTVPVTGLATFVTEPIADRLLGRARVPPVGLARVGFGASLLRDPDKLQSEEYQIRKRSSRE